MTGVVHPARRRAASTARPEWPGIRTSLTIASGHRRGEEHTCSQPLEEFETIAKLADLVAVGTQLFRQERSHVSVVVGDEDVPEGGAGRRMTNLSKRLKQDPKLGPCLST